MLVALIAAATSYTFFSLGDWGGASDNHPTTATERANAAGMQAAAAQAMIEMDERSSASALADRIMAQPPLMERGCARGLR